MRLKTLAHCNIIKMFDGVDVIKLNPTFNCDMFCGVVTKFIAHIMFTIDVLLLARKLNNDCGLVHRNLCQSSIFVDAAGEWKLGSMEFVWQFSTDSLPPPKLLYDLNKYNPTKIANEMKGRIKLLHEEFKSTIS